MHESQTQSQPDPQKQPKGELGPPLKNKKFMLAVGLATVLLAVVAVLGLLNKSTPSVRQAPAAIQPATVQITNKGFMPGTIKISKGTTIVWDSKDESTTHIVAANPYPSHQDLPDLVSKQLGNGAKYSYQFNQIGTFKYHDDLNPALNGVVIVQ